MRLAKLVVGADNAALEDRESLHTVFRVVVVADGDTRGFMQQWLTCVQRTLVPMSL